MAKNQKLIDLSGLRFGLWTITNQAGNARRGAAKWNAICDCGEKGTPVGCDLRSGKSTSCGCLQRLNAGVTHGGSGTRIHRIWKAMKNRCTNQHERYKISYDGISICDEWLDFLVFRDWSNKNGYSDSLSIDRIDNSKGYYPENCRWTTAEVQSQNRRFVLKNDSGIPWVLIAKQHGIRCVLMHSRIHSGWPIEKAATLPKGSRLAKN